MILLYEAVKEGISAQTSTHDTSYYMLPQERNLGEELTRPVKQRKRRVKVKTTTATVSALRTTTLSAPPPTPQVTHPDTLQGHPCIVWIPKMTMKT